MQKFLFAIALLIASLTGAQAQTNVVKVNIFSPLVKTGSFFYEHSLGHNRSLQVGGLFTHWTVGDNTKITGFAVTPEYRFYLSENKPALQGFYVAPFARYQNLTLTVSDDSPSMRAQASLNTVGGGLLVGHQWLFSQRFSLDSFIGPSYNGGSIKLTAGNQSESFDPGPFTGFGIRTGVTFGVAF